MWMLAMVLAAGAAEPTDCDSVRRTRELAVAADLSTEVLDTLIERVCSEGSRSSLVPFARTPAVFLPRAASSVDNLPTDTKRVAVERWSGVTSVSYAPAGLDMLSVPGARVSSVDYLPRGLKVLDASDTLVTSVNYLPTTLQVLDISGTPVTALDYLPRDLRVLDASGTGVTSVSYLPTGLKVLDVSNTPVTSVDNLPAGLLLIDVRGTRVASLDYLPKSVVCVLADAWQKSEHRVEKPADCPIDPALLGWIE